MTPLAAHIEVPVEVPITIVRTGITAEMRDAVASALPGADALIMAAAPADYRPASAAIQKIKKPKDGSTPTRTIDLVETDDILASTIELRPPGCVVVGFALETENLLTNSEAKLKQKQLDLIVANDATEPGAGFGTPTNRVTLLGRDGSRDDFPLMSKAEVADVLLDRVETLLSGR